MNRFFCVLAATFVVALVFAPIGMASTVSEVGDAGNLPGTAQITSDPALTSITGSIGSKDQDMYRIQVGSTQATVAFSAKTYTGSDPRLYLFDSNGRQIAGNDDCARYDAESCINITLAQGTYYIAIAGGYVPRFDSANVITSWYGQGGPGFSYTINLSSGGAKPNRAPTAGALSVRTPKNTSGFFTLKGADADGDPLVYTITTQPLHGTVTCAGASCQYKPFVGYVGTDSLAYTVTDPYGASAAGTVAIKVTRG